MELKMYYEYFINRDWMYTTFVHVNALKFAQM